MMLMVDPARIYQFWTGLLLVAQCELVLMVTVNSDIGIFLSILLWLCLNLIPLVALLQVYNSSFLNILKIVYLSYLLAMGFVSIEEYNE